MGVFVKLHQENRRKEFYPRLCRSERRPGLDQVRGALVSFPSHPKEQALQ